MFFRSLNITVFLSQLLSYKLQSKKLCLSENILCLEIIPLRWLEIIKEGFS